jgi:tetratricopeptide (TPR) repeat protein
MIRSLTTHRSGQRFCGIFFLVFSLAASAFAQRTPDPTTEPGKIVETVTTYRTDPGTAILVFNVFGEKARSRLDRQALLTLVNLADQSATWTTTEDNAKGVLTNVRLGSYQVDVSAVGYLTAHKELAVMDTLRPSEIEIVLQRDPSAINLDVSDAIMSPKARKQAKHAISLLKSRNLPKAQKQLDEAYKLAPGSPDLNFLLGYLYYQKKDLAQAGVYLDTAAKLSPHNPQTLALLGRTKLERQDYPAARSALEEAVMADAENWLPHGLLADTYLHERDYDKAHEEAQIALKKGKDAAGSMQLVLGESLIGLGRDQEATQVLNSFLEASPRHPMANDVRKLIAGLKDHPSSATPGTPTNSGVKISVIDPLGALPEPGLPAKAWQPPGIDELKLSTAPGIKCPSEQVIEESGKRVQELMSDIDRFAAVEDLFHQRLDDYGIPIRTEMRKYNYVASISEPAPGILNVDEYRAEKLTLGGYPDQIASQGFAALALVFHPHRRDEFEMLCEGQGDWHGQATWLVHFRQRENRPNHMHAYKVGNQIHAVPLKGRAWITADKFQIVRIEAEMLQSMPEIQLISEHQVVEYGPVPFPKKNTTLWLPKSAEIYFDFRKHHYYRRHSFDHFMLYSVESDEKRKEPVAQKSDKKILTQE